VYYFKYEKSVTKTLQKCADVLHQLLFPLVENQKILVYLQLLTMIPNFFGFQFNKIDLRFLILVCILKSKHTPDITVIHT